MICIYDTVIAPTQTVLRRYGVNYKLENKNHMGDRCFYSFTYPSREKILVIPGFMEQYNQVKNILSRFPKKGTLDKYLVLIKKRICRDIETDEIPDEDCQSGMMTVIRAEFEDIRVELDFCDDHLEINPEFEIVRNNIFGDGIVVLTGMNMEES